MKVSQKFIYFNNNKQGRKKVCLFGCQLDEDQNQQILPKV